MSEFRINNFFFIFINLFIFFFQSKSRLKWKMFFYFIFFFRAQHSLKAMILVRKALFFYKCFYLFSHCFHLLDNPTITHFSMSRPVSLSFFFWCFMKKISTVYTYFWKYDIILTFCTNTNTHIFVLISRFNFEIFSGICSSIWNMIITRDSSHILVHELKVLFIRKLE